MNWIDILPLAQIDTSFAEKHERTGSIFSSGFWFPEEASEFAPQSDFLFMAITYISAIFFAVIVGVMILFVIKYRRRPGVEPQPSPSHNTALEIFWSVVPAIILVWFFYAGANGFLDLRIPTDDAEEIHVTAARWNWSFRYPNGDTSTELHLVKDQPVRLIMQSTDVLHSMFVSAFRQKMDIVPGRYTYAFINPTKVGKFRLACTEYCGTEHSRMRTLCQVHESEEARRSSTEWIRAKYPPWETGQRLFQMNCSGCHKVDGNAATGPALNAIWDTNENLVDGSTIKVDEEYLRSSILYPDRHVVAGYGPVSKMNSFDGKLTRENQMDLIAYIKYVNDPGKYGDTTPVGELNEQSGGENSVDEPADAADAADSNEAATDDAESGNSVDGNN